MQLKAEKSHVSFTASAGSIGFTEIRMLPASAMPGAIFMDKASLAQIPC